MEWNAKWLKTARDFGEVAPLFEKDFSLSGDLRNATLYLTALGAYEASLNGKRVSDYVLAPGWTVFEKRLQYQAYDVTNLLEKENHLNILVGKGWYHSRLGWTDRQSPSQMKLHEKPIAVLAQLEITYKDGSTEQIVSDESFRVRESGVRFSEIYDGEIFDANIDVTAMQNPDAVQTHQPEIYEEPFSLLIPQQGEEIREQERLAPAQMFTTPKGEVVIDFGQNLTGYVEIAVTASRNDLVDLSFAEVMDKEGNFYTENYRSARAQYHYICKDGYQTYKPKVTFFGFRYIRINAFPGGLDAVSSDCFTAVVVHSDMKRTGHLSCSDPLLNKLFDNIVWGQKGNFLDVPTDCPQRDERLGWTGDAQVFIRTACLNYDTEKFYTKWLADLAVSQYEDGHIGHVIPDVLDTEVTSSAWGDAATVCPWEVYLAYGNAEILASQFDSMKKWVDYITGSTKDTFLWTGGKHFGDWLALDAPSGSYKGSSNEDLIATAFYAYSTSLVIKAGKVLKEDVSAYETLYKNIVDAFRRTYPEYHTQTECVLAAHFGLASDCQAAADQLAKMVTDCGMQLQTGFVGTPYLLHVLSDYGYTELAYSLLLRRQYPSWLYSVTRGATTIWEHWDGIMEDGNFWSKDMNSYNHYAYGSVADWVYGKAAGFQVPEEAPGYEKVRIAPLADGRIDWLKAEYQSRHGLIISYWKKEGNLRRYEITTPVEAEIVIAGAVHHVPAGSYIFYSKN